MTAEDYAELRLTCQARALEGDRVAMLTLNLMRKYEDLLQDDHSNSVLEAIRADDAARLLAAKDNLIRGLCDRTEAQSQLLSGRAEK